MAQPEVETFTCAGGVGPHNASASRSAWAATDAQNASALATLGEEKTSVFFEDVAAAIAAQAVGEERVVDRAEIQRATDDQFMVRVYFVGEDDFEAYHVTAP